MQPKLDHPILGTYEASFIFKRWLRWGYVFFGSFVVISMFLIVVLAGYGMRRGDGFAYILAVLALLAGLVGGYIFFGEGWRVMKDNPRRVDVYTHGINIIFMNHKIVLTWDRIDLGISSPSANRHRPLIPFPGDEWGLRYWLTNLNNYLALEAIIQARQSAKQPSAG